MKSFILFLIISFTLFGAFTASAQLVLPSVMIRAVTANNRAGVQRTALQLCQMSGCRTIGRPQGYTNPEWGAIRDLCRTQALYIQPGLNIFAGFMSLCASTVRHVGAGVVCWAMGMRARSEGSHGEEARAAYQSIPGIRAGGRFEVDFDTFANIRNGIAYCTQKFEEHVEYMQRVDECSSGMAVGCSDIFPGRY